MKLFRFLIPVGALLALLAFLPACDSDSGGDGGGGTDTVTGDDTTGGGEDTTGGDDTTTPECDPCEELQDGECVAISCPDGQACNVDSGECEDVVEECDPADCAPCEECDEATNMCVSTCEEGEECQDGACVVPLVCDPPCGAGETCEDAGDGTGVCESICDADMCMSWDDAAGECVSDCNEDQVCIDGTCDAKPPVECVNENEYGYCDASIVDELVIAEAPAPDAGVEGCCCDFTGDGVYDNQIAALVGQLGTMAGFDLPTLNQTVADSLAEGSFIILFEYVGLAADAADTDYFDVNFFLGADMDDPEDPTDNFSGSEEFYIMAESMVDGEPLITFEGASVAGGVINAGPSQFVIPVELEDPPLDLTLTVDSAIMSANITSGAAGYELADGTLCGYVTIQQIFNALNDFATSSCGCLNLTGDLIEGADGAWTCGESDNQCSADDQIGEICGTIAQYCDTAVLLLPSFLDVDLDGDDVGDAISVGATFGATSAVLAGEEPAM